MDLPQSNTQTPVISYTRTELLSIKMKTSLLSLSTFDRVKDLNIGFNQSGKSNAHPFIVASFNAQSVKSNDMACKPCDTSTTLRDNDDHHFL